MAYQLRADQFLQEDRKIYLNRYLSRIGAPAYLDVLTALDGFLEVHKHTKESQWSSALKDDINSIFTTFFGAQARPSMRIELKQETLQQLQDLLLLPVAPGPSRGNKSGAFTRTEQILANDQGPFIDYGNALQPSVPVTWRQVILEVMNEITERIDVDILPEFWASKEGIQLLQDHELFPSGSLAPVGGQPMMELSTGEVSMDSEDNLLEGASDENDDEQDTLLVFRDDHFASSTPTVSPLTVNSSASIEPAAVSSSQGPMNHTRKPSIIMSGVRSLKNMANNLSGGPERAVSASSSTTTSPIHDDSTHSHDAAAASSFDRSSPGKKEMGPGGVRQANDALSHGSNGPNSGDGPLDALYDVVLEIFDLRERNNWFRRQATTLIIQQIMGGTIERKISQNLQTLCSDQSLQYYLKLIDESVWPDGEFIQMSPRTQREKAEGFERASAAFMNYILATGTPILGRSNCKRGAKRVFDMLQISALNEILLITLVDALSEGIMADVHKSDSNHAFGRTRA